MHPGTRIRIGIVAGETSGDVLAAGLMRALKAQIGPVAFEGIGGPRMQAEGCTSWYPMERLSIIGFEALRKCGSIVAIRRALVRRFRANPPDLFIGVDAPDFNLTLEQRLRASGIPTLHYVSPTVWAWRGYRLRKIRRAVDHMLALFPFEQRYYETHGVPVTFVGHPLADEIPEDYDPAAYRRQLDLPSDRVLVALLPGSRVNELHRHADLFVQTAQWLHARHPRIHFVAPFVNGETQAIFIDALARQRARQLPLTLLAQHSREALAACDVALLASGTATLEAALLRKLMVVTYKVSPLSAVLIRLFSHVKLYSLPNNLAGRELVPELLQDDAVPEKLGAAVERYLAHGQQATVVAEELRRLHRALRQGADERAAMAVISLLRTRGRPSDRAAAAAGADTAVDRQR